MAQAPSRKVFCPPPLGAPDLREPFPGLDKVDNRKRVKVGPERCIYAVIDMIRYHIGEDPLYAKSPKRRVEVAYDTLRQRIAVADDEFPDTHPRRSLFKLITHANIDKGNIDRLVATENAFVKETVAQFKDEKKFKDLLASLQYKKFDKFLKHLEDFLHEVGIDPKFKIADEEPPPDCPHPRFTVVDGYCTHLIGYNLGLTRTKWNPTLPFKDLLSSLQEEGPFCASGHFGFSSHKEPPVQLKHSIEGQAVFGWKPQKEQAGNVDQIFHAILIVGAQEASQQELVYYVDPTDVNDPSRPEQRRIYVMSYKKFTSNALYLVSGITKEGQDYFIYGYHGPYHKLSKQAAGQNQLPEKKE